MFFRFLPIRNAIAVKIYKDSQSVRNFVSLVQSRIKVRFKRTIEKRVKDRLIYQRRVPKVMLCLEFE